MEFLIYGGGFLFLMLLGVIFGSLADRRHLASLNRREQECQNVICSQSQQYVEPFGPTPPVLFCAETVVANDYFKRFKASFRSFFGGEVKSYNILMDRARRETMLKIIEQARASGYNAVCNMRLESADVGGNVSKKGMSIVCIMGSATAYNSSLSKG